ncbi:MAG TPA: YhbD family protein [Bacillales bacterium]|nr:YhbD family protein [Bacillales bacterium]
MEEAFISKKELLDATGISYGQLYRWKRKHLIPEEWFIRKSTYTGQETFFPRERILDRIEKIQQLKGDLSLDELAGMLSPDLADTKLPSNELSPRGICSQAVLDFYMERYGEKESFTFGEVLQLYVLHGLLTGGNINRDEGKMVLQVMKDHSSEFENESCTLLIIRKLGVSACLLCSNLALARFDEETKVVEQIDLAEKIQALKMKWL